MGNLLQTGVPHKCRALLSSPPGGVLRGEVERMGITHWILEAGPQVLHGVVELSLLSQGPKDEALDVLRWVDSREKR